MNFLYNEVLESELEENRYRYCFKVVFVHFALCASLIVKVVAEAPKPGGTIYLSLSPTLVTRSLHFGSYFDPLS